MTLLIRHLCILIFLNVVESHEMLVLNETNTIPRRIVKQFQKYDLIIHYDNETSGELNIFFDPNDLKRMKAMRLVNYDKNKILERPSGLLYINVVFLRNPWNFEEYASIEYNLNPLDVVLMIIRSMKNCTYKSSGRFRRFWEQDGLYRAGGLFIFNLSNSRLYSCCFFCGNKSKVLKVISKNETLPDLTRLVNNFTNFNGHLFHIAYAHFPPFFYCRYEVDHRCTPHGSEGQMLRTFSKLFNFKYTLRMLNKTDGEGEWDAMVKAVYHKEVDWAVGGISASLKRTDFTRYIKTQGFTVLFSVQQKPWMTVKNVILVFHWPVLASIGMCIVIIGVIGKVSLYLYNAKDQRCASSFMKNALRSLVEQSVPNVNKSKWMHSLKTLFLVWWLFSLCFTTYYKSQLASLLIKPKNGEPDNIEQLVAKGYSFQANHQDWSVLKENFLDSSLKVYKQVLKRINNNLELCDSVVHTLKNKVGVIDEETPLQYEVYKYCSQNLSTFERSKIRLVHQNLFPGGFHSWCFQMSAPFVKRFSRTIGRMNDIGLIDHWYNGAFAYKLPRSNENLPGEFAALNMIHMLAPFVVLGIGFTVALLAFILESLAYLK